jgi:glutamate dehydrogenase
MREAGKPGSSVPSLLKWHIAESQLPVDDPLPEGRLDEIADFLLTAAMLRLPGEASIELALQTDGRRSTRVAIVNEDMPFLVDSIASTLAGQGLVIDFLVHPVAPVRRDDAGRLACLVHPDDEGAVLESMIYIETGRIDARQRRELERALKVTLGDVRAAVGDWQKMIDAMTFDAERVADPEGKQLLHWFASGMLTQLGHVTRHRNGRLSQVLGVCRASTKSVLSDDTYERAFAWFDAEGKDAARHAPLIVKANRISRVHRHVPLDLFIVPRLENDEVGALSVHAGIWTSAALTMPPEKVPRIRRQFAELTEKLGFDPASHTGKALLHAFTALPNDLLVGFDDEDVCRLATRMSDLVDRPRPRLTLVEAPLARHLFAFVWLPRDMVSTQTRLRIKELLEAGAGGETLDWSLQVEEGALALLRFVLDIRQSQCTPDEKSLDQRLQVMLRGWSEAVEHALAERGEPTRAAALAIRYADAFPIAYRMGYGPLEAALDLERMQLLEGTAREADGRLRDARLFRLEGEEPGQLRLKIYQHEGQLPLSDAVPVLENFGFRVLAEVPTSLADGRMGTIHDFKLGLQAEEYASQLLERAGEIEAAIASVLNNRSENDLFNRLVTDVGLDTAEADWLRAMFRYLRQIGLAFTVYTVVNALACAPGVTRALVALFRARLDPEFKEREKLADLAREDIRSGLAEVPAINDDRVLRLYNGLIEAVLRTNAFAPAAQEALALKIDSAKVPELPTPLPWREVFVYSRRVEGIHLRAGPVARGGLRWSDRRDDYRTEVLGLMKAQRVKNAVIVPTGAKGGFFPKELPDPAQDRDGWAAEGQASYETFVRSLLSVTDNIVDGKVRHPERVVAWDGDDPYFVVAADKGTARFSDLANAIAERQGFWLGDAFASGGSNGYDHKAMGITARGAWISVQRHFTELGTDIQEEPIRVVGCGDMSGDVFGNGMLLSKAIKLVAAFDHRHIFIDPAPDPETAWKERKRLFELPRSSWADYDSGLISQGGGVWPRSMKRIPVSAEARDLLGIAATELAPDALIAAILAAPADLLWLGGIGTFIKASGESDEQVRDPANDGPRIDASQLRVKVIGEGANLGITQAGRIEFALAGGRINTDFIDNSAGVNCSDNEVNIKIALDGACRAGRLSTEERNALLGEMTEQVASLVLEDNRLQALALSVAEREGAEDTAAQIQLIQLLEDSGELERKAEGFADAETLTRRANEGTGLTRPELAALLSTTKLLLQGEIEESSLPDDPGLLEVLRKAFPQKLRERFDREIREHRLRREIIATKLANRIVNRLGLVHPFELAEVTGVNLAQVARAFVVAERLFDLDALWQQIEASRMPESARLLLLDRLAGVVRSHMADLLRVGAGRTSPSELCRRLQSNVATLDEHASSLLKRETRRQSQLLKSALIERGVPATEAAAVVHLYDLDGAAGIAQLAVDSGISPLDLAEIFTVLGEQLGLDWAQATAAIMSPSDPWERLLVSGLARDLQQVRLEFLRRVARSERARRDLSQAVVSWTNDHPNEIRQFRTTVARARASPAVTPAMLAHIASHARRLFAL